MSRVQPLDGISIRKDESTRAAAVSSFKQRVVMRIKKINYYLVATILTLSISSFFASYSLIDEILDSSISLSINPKTSNILESYQKDLKKLRAFDPANSENYRTQFFEIQEAMYIYKEPQELASVIKSSYLTYFLIIFLLILAISIAAAFFLSLKVSRSYKRLVESDLDKSRRLQELEYFDNWQNIAASLAHEIKNPLTPIEMMMTNLSSSYSSNDDETFQKNLQTTQKVVLDEVNRLKNMVNHFSRFSKLPTPSLAQVQLFEYFTTLFEGFKTSWPKIHFSIEIAERFIGEVISIDELLLKQCFLNLVQNAIEANPQHNEMVISLIVSQKNENQITLLLKNTGREIPTDIRRKLFQFGFSTKGSKINQGIGLSVVKKIMLDHGGDIAAIADDSGATFRLTLPSA